MNLKPLEAYLVPEDFCLVSSETYLVAAELCLVSGELLCFCEVAFAATPGYLGADRVS